MDDRLQLAATLEAEADADWRAVNWLMDTVTERCRDKREKARQLREHVAQERDIARIEADANAELTRRGRRRQAA